MDNNKEWSSGKKRRSGETPEKVYNNGERIIMTSYLQMRNLAKLGEQQNTGKPVGGYFAWSDDKGGVEPSDPTLPSSRTKTSGRSGWRETTSGRYPSTSDRKVSWQEANPEDSWLNQTGNTQDLMISRTGRSSKKKSSSGRYKEQPLVPITPPRLSNSKSRSRSRSSRKKKQTSGRYVYGISGKYSNTLQEKSFSRPKPQKSSNKSLYLAKKELIKVGGRTSSKNRVISSGKEGNSLTEKEKWRQQSSVESKLSKSMMGPNDSSQSPQKPLTKAQERQRRLDEYYRKKLKYLEEKSQILEEVRKRQEQEDLRIMGTSIPTISERSRVLAKLHNQKKQLISNEKFLKRYFDHEKNRFELRQNRDYVYSPPPNKKPLPREWVFNDFEAAEADLPRYQKDKSLLVKAHQNSPRVNQFGEYEPEKGYKYSTKDFHERACAFFKREHLLQEQAKQMRQPDTDGDDGLDVPKVRTRLKLLKEQDAKQASEKKSSEVWGCNPLQLSNVNVRCSNSSAKKGDYLQSSAKENREPGTDEAVHDEAINLRPNIIDLLQKTELDRIEKEKALTQNKHKDNLATEETRGYSQPRKLDSEEQPRQRYSLFGLDAKEKEKPGMPRVDMSFLDPVRNMMGRSGDSELEDIPELAPKRKVDPWTEVPPDKPRKHDFIENEKIIASNRKLLYSRTGIGGSGN